MMDDRVASCFMLQGVQEWGQTTEERAKATGDFLRAAGFDVEDSGYPIFAGMFPQQPIRGKDGEAAYKWLDALLRTMQRGDCNSEIRQLNDALAARTSARVG